MNENRFLFPGFVQNDLIGETNLKYNYPIHLDEKECLEHVKKTSLIMYLILSQSRAKTVYKGILTEHINPYRVESRFKFLWSTFWHRRTGNNELKGKARWI